MDPQTNDQMPTAVLKSEHQVILRVLRVLEHLVVRADRGEGFEADSFKKCVEFFRFFADACHHAKEEDLFFPVLESRGIPRDGGPIGVMLEEHRQARAHTKDMGDALEAVEGGDADGEQRFRAAARRYLDLLNNHIYKEDNVLFNMGDHVMTDDDQQTLCGKFCEVGCRAFGGKKREELARMADELESRWQLG